MVALNRRLATLSVPKSLVGIAVVGVAYFAALSAQRIHFVEQQNTVALGYRSENAPQAFFGFSNVLADHHRQVDGE